MALNINGTTGISGVDGSVSAPALTGSDSNTGITFPAADTIKFSTGGVERMAITNSGVSGITAGITMADQWRLTSNLTMSQNSEQVITANWERVDTDNFAVLGSGMSESSGVFTFPSTGIYLIRFIVSIYASASAASENRLRIHATTDNSDFNLAAETYVQNYAQYTYSTGVCEFQFDCTNTSTHKINFKYYTGGTSVLVLGSSNHSRTHATFIRLGDT